MPRAKPQPDPALAPEHHQQLGTRRLVAEPTATASLPRAPRFAAARLLVSPLECITRATLYPGRSGKDRGVKDYFRVEDGRSAVIIDARHMPVLITTQFGPPTRLTLLAQRDWLLPFYEDLERRGLRFASIVDARDGDRPPVAVRKLLADLHREYGHYTDRLSVIDLMVHENPLLLGALAAVKWLTAGRFPVEPAQDFADAIARCSDALRKHGIAPPTQLCARTYQRPAAPPGGTTPGT